MAAVVVVLGEISERGASDTVASGQWAALCGRVVAAGVPGVEAGDTEGFEVLGVSGRDGHLGDLGDGGDEGVIQRRVFGYSVGGKDSGGRHVEWQYAAGEGGQDPLVEPVAQDLALRRVGSFLGDDATFDLGDRGSRDELVGHWDGRCPGFEESIAASES
jgi:hypothetical protein